MNSNSCSIDVEEFSNRISTRIDGDRRRLSIIRKRLIKISTSRGDLKNISSIRSAIEQDKKLIKTTTTSIDGSVKMIVKHIAKIVKCVSGKEFFKPHSKIFSRFFMKFERTLADVLIDGNTIRSLPADMAVAKMGVAVPTIATAMSLLDNIIRNAKYASASERSRIQSEWYRIVKIFDKHVTNNIDAIENKAGRTSKNGTNLTQQNSDKNARELLDAVKKVIESVSKISSQNNLTNSIKSMSKTVKDVETFIKEYVDSILSTSNKIRKVTELLKPHPPSKPRV